MDETSPVDIKARIAAFGGGSGGRSPVSAGRQSPVKPALPARLQSVAIGADPLAPSPDTNDRIDGFIPLAPTLAAPRSASSAPVSAPAATPSRQNSDLIALDDAPKKRAPPLPARKPTAPVNGNSTSNRHERLFDSLAARCKIDGRLHPLAVEQLWSRSRLPNERLSAIWLACGGSARGLDRTAFVRGMTMIDDALARM